MKKVIYIWLVIAAVACSMSTYAQTVGYSDKELTSYALKIEFSVAKQDTVYSIIATMTSEKMKFLNEPIMKVRTFNDEVLTLNGSIINNNSETAGVIVNGIFIPITKYNSTAQFIVSPEQFEAINNGISKIRLSTTPKVHERTFKKDKIGKKLYLFYLKAKHEDDNF